MVTYPDCETSVADSSDASSTSPIGAARPGIEEPVESRLTWDRALLANVEPVSFASQIGKQHQKPHST